MSRAPGEAAIQLDPAVLLATGLGLGYAPRAPGTVGSIWGIPLALGFRGLASGYLGYELLLIAVASLLAVPLCTRAARILKRGHDPGCIVLDEIVSMPLVFVGIPLDVRALVIGFALHRVIDIVKPPPGRSLERLPAGWGIVSDDLMAAAYACLAMHGLRAWGVLG